MSKLSTSEIEKALHHLPKAGDLGTVKLALRGQLLTRIGSIEPVSSPSPASLVLKWAPLGLATLIVVTSGTAALADSAKPGDLLYPVDTFTESVAGSLIKDQASKAKYYAAISEERVSELNAIDVSLRGTEDIQQEERMESLREFARSRAAASFEQLNQVQAVVLEKYSTATDESQKASYLTLSKKLQQVIDRKAARAKTLHEILDGTRSTDDDLRIDDHSKQAIRVRIRKEFKLEDKPEDYQFHDPAIPKELTPPLRDGDKDGIPDREDPWVPRPLDDSGHGSGKDAGESHSSLFPVLGA